MMNTSNGSREGNMHPAHSRRRASPSSESGTALVASVVFLFVLTLTGLGYLGFGAREAESIRRDYADMQTRWAAEQALSEGMARANRGATPNDTLLVAVDTGDFVTRFRISKLEDARFPRFSVVAYVHDEDFSNPPTCSLAAVIQAGTPASKLFYFEDHSNGIYFYTGDTIDGPVHTNTRFAIAGTPVFQDRVFQMGEVEKGFITHPDYQSTPILKSGKPQGGDIYRFDHMSQGIRKVPPGNWVEVEPNQVLAIEFKGSLMEIRTRNMDLPYVYSDPILRPIPKEGGLFVDGSVEVKGLVAKTLTLGSSGNIIITDDLVYSGSHPITGEPKATSTVHLGLIAEQNVQVKQSQARETGGRGIRINASIVAMASSFQVTNLLAHSWDMGTMHFWGTIAQVERGQIGAEKARNQFRGYHKDWHFDRRLVSNPNALPYFPPLLTKDGRMGLTPVWFGALEWIDHV